MSRRRPARTRRSSAGSPAATRGAKKPRTTFSSSNSSRVGRSRCGSCARAEALTVAVSEPTRAWKPIGDHQRLVEDEQVRDLGLVGLELVECRPDVRLLVGRVLELDHRDRQAVDEAHQVGPPGVLGALDGELVHDQKAVCCGCRSRSAARGRRAFRRLAPLPLADRRSTPHESGGCSGSAPARAAWPPRCTTSSSTVSGMPGFRRRSASSNRPSQQHLPIVGALGRLAVRRDVRAVRYSNPESWNQARADLFEIVFRHSLIDRPYFAALQHRVFSY